MPSFLNSNLKTNRIMGVLRKLQNLQPRVAVITIYEAFPRHFLDFVFVNVLTLIVHLTLHFAKIRIYLM